MISHFRSLVLFITILSIYGDSYGMDLFPETKEAAYDHLKEINAEWKHHLDIAPNHTICFDNDNDRISYHLNLVVNALQLKTPDGFTRESLDRRKELLSILQEYANIKVFPTNLYHEKRTPYFIDDFGVHCAVGYLIMKSGHSDLSNRIRNEHNYDYIADIKTPGVLEWAKEYGFELSELAWIQPAYSSPTIFSGIGDTDGEVTAMCKDETNNRLIYAGDFSNINEGNTSCSGIGYYQAGTMHCLGGGLDGTINHVYESEGNIYVSGLLNSGSTPYSQAVFSGGNWTYVNIPGMEGKEARIGMSGGTDFKRELVLKNDQGSNEHEVWRLSNSDVWEKQATANGAINGISQGTTHSAYGGAFTALTLHLSTGDQQLNTINACLRENNSENWTELTGQVGIEVFVVKWLNETFFFGGEDIPPANVDEPFAPIAMLHSDTLIGLYGGLTPNFMTGNNTSVIVTDLDVVSSTKLVICGEFSLGLETGEVGQSLGVIDLTNFPVFAGQPGPGNILTYAKGSWLSADINFCAILNQTLYAGGLFNSAPTDTVFNQIGWSYDPIYSEVNNIAKMDEVLNVSSKNLVQFNLYPNPAHDIVTIDSELKLQRVSVLDMNGRILLETNTSKINLQNLKAGHYLIRVVTESGERAHKKVVKI